MRYQNFEKFAELHTAYQIKENFNQNLYTVFGYVNFNILEHQGQNKVSKMKKTKIYK